MEVNRAGMSGGLAGRIDRLQWAARQPTADPWPSFQARASDYYALLSEFVATGVPCVTMNPVRDNQQKNFAAPQMAIKRFLEIIR